MSDLVSHIFAKFPPSYTRKYVFYPFVSFFFIGTVFCSFLYRLLVAKRWILAFSLLPFFCKIVNFQSSQNYFPKIHATLPKMNVYICFLANKHSSLIYEYIWVNFCLTFFFFFLSILCTVR